MKQIAYYFVYLMLAGCISLHHQGAQAQAQFEPEDKEIANGILEQLKKLENANTAELVVAAGNLLLETPYVAHTLEYSPEKLRINLRELDCTTYAENCLALALTAQSEKSNFKAFCKHLQYIRYRNGMLETYPSRLHYFSDWIYNNAEKDLIRDVSESLAQIPYPNAVNFMSSHPDSYKQLKENAVFVSALRKQEQVISSRKYFYIPKDKLSKFENQYQEGDIIGITTGIDGLDITHVGILVKKNHRIHLMHASSKAEKVVVSENTLEDYLLNRKSATGIMIARPN